LGEEALIGTADGASDAVELVVGAAVLFVGVESFVVGTTDGGDEAVESVVGATVSFPGEFIVGTTEGKSNETVPVGADVFSCVEAPEGAKLGCNESVATLFGAALGKIVVAIVGVLDGYPEGACDSIVLGATVGFSVTSLGGDVCVVVGAAVGISPEVLVGEAVRNVVGFIDGKSVAEVVGALVGNAVREPAGA
jgi:hypothetical protein